MTNAAKFRTPPSPAALDLQIENEQACDAVAREALLDAAFGRARFRKTCERLREGRLPTRGLALVARDGSRQSRRIVGTVRLWHVVADGVPMLMLGPLAVAKSHRGLGVGDALMRAVLGRAKVLGHRAVILVGDAPYYAKFGFSRAPVQALAMPGPVELDRFLGLEFWPGALAQARGRVAATGQKAPVRVKTGRALRAA